MDKIPVLFDTDIGTNIDDALALAYLLRQPRCELLGVTTVSGDVQKRAALAAWLCDAAGRADVPVVAGASGPLLHGPGQAAVPQFDANAERMTRRDFRSDAVEFMGDAIHARRGAVTLISVGPFTNVALLLATYPEVADMLKRYVFMGGVYFPNERPAETNTIVDPASTAIAFQRAPRNTYCVGLDVTLQCHVPVEEVRERFAASEHLRHLLPLAEVWFEGRERVVFHDPLAAGCAFDDTLCTWKRGDVTVHICPEHPHPGSCTFDENSDGRFFIADSVRIAAFFEDYFAVVG